MIVDTHIHLYDEKYEKDFPKIIDDAFKKSVSKMVVVGFDFLSSQKAVQMAVNYPNLYASVGLHPSEVGKHLHEDLSWIKDLSKNPKVVAIGEIGLDYYWDKSFKELQQKQFVNQIDIANELGLPVIVHNREAANDTFQILKQKKPRGVLHCYSGSVEMAREFVKLGFYLGIGGVVTFKNSIDIKKVVTEIDLRFLLSETDGPYLAPTPYRGKINKPEYLPLVIDAIASLKGIAQIEVEKQLFLNANYLFNI